MNEDNSLFNDMLLVGGLTTALPALGYLSKVNDDLGISNKLAQFNSKLIGSDYLNKQLDRTLVSTTSSQLLSSSEQSLRKTLLSQFMAFEEASPLHILRTLQISNFFQPLTPLSSSDDVIHISPNSIRNQQHYYESLLKYINDDNNQKVKRHLKVQDLTRGFYFKNNVLYGATKSGEIDTSDIVLKNARLTLSSVKNGEIYSQNNILSKYANILGSHIDNTGSKSTPLMVIGAKNGLDFSKNWVKSTLRFGMEVGFKTLDNPIAGIEEMFNMAGADYTGIFKTRGYQKLRELSSKVGLGTNGNYDLGIRESLKISAKNIALKGGGLYLGYEGLDSILRTISPDNGIFSQGLATGLANTYASSRIAFAKVWSDRFQGYKEKQEQSAPGSTNLTTLMAFPLGGALLGAQLSYFNRIGHTMIKGTEEAANIFNVESESKFLRDNFKFDTKLKPMKKNALLGGMIGGALTLPFLPGALIGTSSKELEELYSGEKEIQEKATKGWLFCLPPTQEVYTESGLKKAVEITLKDRLMDRSGTYKEIVRLLKRPVDEKIYNITVSGSKHIENKMTGNHPILTINGWVNAEDVRVNDVVIAPKPKILENYSLDLKDILHSVELEGEFLYNTCKRQGKISRSKGYTKRFLQLTPELGKIFGWFLAEGCISKGLLEFTFDISEIDFATDCAEYLKNTFNINYTIVNIKGKAYRLRISSVSLTKIFKLFFYNSFNDTFKKFPNLTITNKEFIRNFLIGLYYGDGGISKTKEDRIKNNGSRSRIRLTTSKLDHVLGVKNYLTLWNIYPCVIKETALSKFPDGTSGIYTSYRICCEGINSFRLANEVGIKKELYNYTKKTEPQISKLKNYWFDEDYLYIKVTNITSEDYKGFVYDFEVKDSHEFQLTSFIVHNSGGAWDGGATKYHTKNWVARMRADAIDKVRYGDDETKKAMNPFLHPLSYLKDPYKFEKRNAESMPYPVWGMDVSYGSFFGKAFERTIGQIIKPDVINPAYLDAIKQGTAYTPVEATVSSSKSSLGNSDLGMFEGKKGISEALVEASRGLFSDRSNQKLQGVSTKDSSLIQEGLMTAPIAPGYNPNQEAISLTYRSLMDFTGIKGWSSSLIVDGLGLEPSVNSIQLARSGEANSSARDLLEQNLGDMLGCFTPEMKVKTINGEKEIQDIEVGDLVLSRGGVYRPVKQVFKKEFKDIDILNISTESSLSLLRCTPDHKMNHIVIRKYPCGHAKPFKYEVIKDEARTLVIGDMLLLPCIDVNKNINIDLGLYSENIYKNFLYPKGIINYKNYDEVSKRKAIPRYLELNKDLGKLFGWWLAEGSAGVDGKISFSMHQKEVNFANELSIIIKNLFGFKSYIKFKEKDLGMTLNFSCKPLALFLRDILGYSAEDKKIPEYMKHNKEFCLGLAYGLIHGDGWCSNNQGGFTSVSEKLVRDLSDILRICNIAHRCDYNYQENRDKHPAPNANENTIYLPRSYINISRNEITKLQNLLELDIKPTRSFGVSNRNFIKDNNQHVKIKNITVEKYSGFVYDLEIDANDSDTESSFKDVNFYVVDLIEVSNSGEFQRKLLPTSSGALPERFNPITNDAASWLPSDKSKYYIDFKHGDQFRAIDRGEERLPGVGYESLYPELKGINVEDYPLVFKHKILSNVAKGSEEFINMRKQAIDAYQQGKLSSREIDILGTTLDQELERDRKKEFYQEPNKLRGPIGSIHNALWETMRTNAESPLEMLTPIRPVAKFLHQRTAIEDYIETQLGGPDTAIWTNPYSHFIKPALNKTRQSLDVSGTFIPEETKEKYNIDEFFDKFKYLKARREKSDFQADSTIIGSTLSGLNTKDKVLKFKRALQDEQKPYFDEFSKETNEKKRDKIRAIIPEDVRRGYEQIWQNLDSAIEAKKSGKNVQEVLGDNISNSTNKLKKAYNVDLSAEDREKARSKVKSNKDNYVNQGISERKRIQFTEDELLRKKMADRESLTFLNNRTGVPNNNFIGWDPRLSSDDIKIRTLSIGNQDLKRFGFWKKDEERMNSLEGIVNTNKVFKEVDKIKEDIRSDRRLKRDIEKVMFDKGYSVNKIDLVDSNYNSILIEND